MTDEEFVKDLLGAPDAKVDFLHFNHDDRGRVLEIEATRRNSSFDGVKFSDMVKLTQHFKCSECDLTTSNYGGCDTCGWGSTHTITLRLWKFDEADAGDS